MTRSSWKKHVWSKFQFQKLPFAVIRFFSYDAQFDNSFVQIWTSTKHFWPKRDEVHDQWICLKRVLPSTEEVLILMAMKVNGLFVAYQGSVAHDWFKMVFEMIINDD